MRPWRAARPIPRRASQETPSSAASWAANEDTAITNLAKSTIKRVRFEVSNEGTDTASGTTYKLEVSEAKRLREIEEENRKLKHLLAEAELDKAALKEIVKGKW